MLTERRFQLLALEVTIATDCPLLNRQLDYLVQDAGQDMPASALAHFAVRLKERTYRIMEGESELAVAYDPVTAMGRLYSACYARANAALPGGSVFLHAASGHHEGRRFLLIGESGAGKTTLILHLASLGASVEGDEIAVMTPEGVAALPRRFHVKSDSLAELPWMHAIVEASPFHDNGDGSFVFAVSPRQLGIDWQIILAPIDAVFFLEPNHGGQPRVEEMARTRMVELAMSQARLPDARDRRWLGPLCAMLNRAGAYKLTVGDLDKTAKILLRTLRDGNALAKGQPW